MPYVRDGKCVYKKNKDGSKGEKTGCSDSVSMAKQYLKALYAQEGEANESVDGEIVEFFDGLLVEARIKDIKAKYPNITQLGWLKYAREKLESEIGEKAPSKYLAFMMREFEKQYKIESSIKAGENGIENFQDAREDLATSVFTTTIDTMTNLVQKFERFQSGLPEKDINKYDYEGLKDAIEAKTSSSEEKQAEKKNAIENSELVYDENDVLVYRPLTTEASCFWGKGTKWCISATEYKNYFDEYTADKKAFIMVIFRNAKQVQGNLKKLAFVLDENGELEEMYDAPDSRYSGKDIEKFSLFAIAQNMYAIDDFDDYQSLSDEQRIKVNEIYYEIMSNGEAVVQNNPPDPSDAYDSAIDRLEEQYGPQINHASFFASVDDGYMYFGASFYIPFDESKLTKELPDNWSESQELAGEIDSALDKDLSVYVEETEIEAEKVVVRLPTDGFESTPSGYESFLEEVVEADKKFEDMKKIVVSVFKKNGYMDRTTFEKLDIKDISDKLANFEVQDNRDFVGDEDISFASSRFGLKNLKFDDLTSQSELLVKLGFQTPYAGGKYFSQAFNDRIISKLNDFNKKIAQELNKQLPLPGIPQEELKSLTLPEMLQVHVLKGISGPDMQFRLVIDDIDITQENIDTIFGVLRYIDQNFAEMTKIADNAASIFFAMGMRAMKQEEKPEQDEVTEYLNSFAKNNQKVNIVDEVSSYLESLTDPDEDEDGDSNFNSDDEDFMKFDDISTEDILDPDKPAPWEIKKEA